MLDLPSVEKRLLECLSRDWPQFANSLASLESHPEFSSFIANYRGHSEAASPERHLHLRESILAQWNSIFTACFNQAQLDADSFSEDLLKSFEASLNTVLYYWIGASDRNFQFRTVVHFLSLADLQMQCSCEVGEFSFRINEWGISFSKRRLFEIFPRRHSLIRISPVARCFDNSFVPLPEESILFAAIRGLQREFCLLIDEWEHCNSILAVKQFSLRKLAPADPGQGQAIMRDIAAVRNALARWCVASAADFQKFIARVGSEQSLHADIRAELSALDAVVLSGFQKFLLPASVSRHVYSNDVLLECARWVDARLTMHPDDLFSQISRLVFQVALNRKSDASALVNLFAGKSFEWTLSSDPSAAIKSVCWGLTPFEHRFFTCTLVVVTEAKLAPNALDSHWLQTFASVVEMPGTFPVAPKNSSDLSISQDQFENLNARALAIISKCCEQTRDEALKAALFVREFLQSELPSASNLSDEESPQ